MKNLKRGSKIYGAELAKQSLSKHATPRVKLGEHLTVLYLSAQMLRRLPNRRGFISGRAVHH